MRPLGGDTEAFIASFIDDAYLVDWGREVHGHEGVTRWNETDNIGKHDHQLRVLPATILSSANRPHPCVRHRQERPPRPRP